MIPSPDARPGGIGTTEYLLTTIARVLFPQTGESFFQSLVEHLATALGVRFSFLCHLAEPECTRLESLAFWGDGKLEGHIDLCMIERLCERVGLRDTSLSSTEVRRLFPEDPWIWNAGIKCCVTIVLRDNSSRLLGYVGVLDDKCLKEPAQIEAALQIIAARAGAEIERQETICRLHESEEKFQSICNAALDPVVLMYETGRVTFWSDRARELFGYTAEEAIGHDMHTLLAPAHYQAAIVRGMAQFRRTGDGPVVGKTHRLTALRKGGAELPIELSISSVRLKGRWHAIGTVRDVSEREQAEATLKASRTKVRRLAAHLQRIREEERRTMAREIHDDLGHTLTALKIDLVRLQQRIDPLKHELHAMVSSLLDSANAAVATVQRLSSELRPAILDDLGLVAAIEWLAAQFQERTGIRCKVTLPVLEPALDDERRTALFRIIQEALTNVARHAGATAVAISLTRANNCRWTATVADDGRGISEEEARGPDALGLLGMQERASTFGGELHIRGVSGQGTRVSVSIPLGS